MFKYFITILLGLITGILIGYFGIIYFPDILGSTIPTPSIDITTPKTAAKKEVLGFLPYWFLDKAKPDYGGYITTLDYFSLTPDVDGRILKYTNPGESEPGYLALTSGKLDTFFQNARAKNIKLSLTIFDGDQDSINNIISDPVNHADNLMNDVAPLMLQYGFSDLNLDLEPVGVASPEAQVRYTEFVKEVKNEITSKNLGTLSMDVIPVDFIRNDHLTVPSEVQKYLDKVILMAYDFHSPSSFVTGPVAPLYGAGTIAEFDTEVTVESALKIIDPSKILLGVPFYGYSWETIDSFERGAIIPASALIKSNSDMERFLPSCSTCSAQFDMDAREHYLIYKNEDSGTYQQIFYPDATSVQAKIDFVKGNSLGGLAIWALGYEGNEILNPIQNYISSH